MTTQHSTSVFRAVLLTVVLASGSLTAQTFPARFAPMYSAMDGRRTTSYIVDDPGPTRARLHRSIRTNAAAASRHFDAALTAYYAYDRADAAREFAEARQIDPRCAMCLVFEAIALGPGIDAVASPESDAESRVAIRGAMRLVPYGQDDFDESAWVRAVSARYFGRSGATRADLDSAYAASMRRLSDENPGDADAATLAAEAQLILMPYDYFTDTGRLRPGARVALRKLQQAMRVAPGHVGACNLYVHLLETRAQGMRCTDSPPAGI